MKYPNNINKTYKPIINFSNRGIDLEIIVNEANKYYLENDIAIIYKKPTSIGIVKSVGASITKGYFKEKSTLDYNGIYKGKYIEFDAKETLSKTAFPLSNIHNHQLEHIKSIIKHQGIAFLIISMNTNYYLLDGKVLLNFIKSNERKSIPYDFLENSGIKLKYNYNIGLDYIQGLDKIMEV